MRLRLALSALLLTVAISARGRAAAVHRITFKEAVAHALQKHPSVATASSKEVAATAKVDIARNEAAPKVSLVAQLNRSTGSVVPGATFALPGIPGIQGPPGTTRFGSGTWQSVAGATASWDILELVRRPTIIGAANSELSVAKAQSQATRLGVAVRTADAYLVVVEARALVLAAEANEQRTKTFHEVVAALVAQKLRPELDLARADTELASARVLSEKTRLGVVLASARLADAIGEDDWSVAVIDGDFADFPRAPAAAKSSHPAVAAYRAAATSAEARASVAKLGYLPTVNLVGAAWLRGGGYVLGGPNSGDAGGLLPDTPNWAVGAVASWTPTEIGTAGAKADAENADAAVQRAQALETSEALITEAKLARAAFTSSVEVAKETAAGVQAARQALQIASTRYTTALGNVLEVADSERALAAAERDDAIARLEAWRAAVAVYAAQGDLDALLAGISKAKG
jgi:outer membrane protein TolC